MKKDLSSCIPKPLRNDLCQFAMRVRWCENNFISHVSGAYHNWTEGEWFESNDVKSSSSGTLRLQPSLVSNLPGNCTKVVFTFSVHNFGSSLRVKCICALCTMKYGMLCETSFTRINYNFFYEDKQIDPLFYWLLDKEN